MYQISSKSEMVPSNIAFFWLSWHGMTRTGVLVDLLTTELGLPCRCTEWFPDYKTGFTLQMYWWISWQQNWVYHTGVLVNLLTTEHGNTLQVHWWVSWLQNWVHLTGVLVDLLTRELGLPYRCTGGSPDYRSGFTIQVYWLISWLQNRVYLTGILVDILTTEHGVPYRCLIDLLLTTKLG